jgi:signal transduction histidine kinase
MSLSQTDLCKQMEDLTSLLAHDLRGSLQVIRAYADLLTEEARGPLEPEQLKCVNFIRAGTEALREKIERGQGRLHELILSAGRLK